MKANNRQIIEINVKKLVNRSNKMTFCSPFISCSVFKNKTVENGKKSKKFYLAKMIKTTLLTKITAISKSQLALYTMTQWLRFVAITEKRSLVLTWLLGISFFQGK